ADGDLVKKIDALGQEIDYSYDGMNRETEEVWKNAGGTTTNTIHFGYNSTTGLLTSAYDNNSGYSYGYDALGRLTSVDNLGGGTPGTPNLPDVLLSYVYDANGNEKSLAAKIGSTQDFKNSYTYNADDWLTEIVQGSQSGGDSVAGKEVDFSY